VTLDKVAQPRRSHALLTRVSRNFRTTKSETRRMERLVALPRVGYDDGGFQPPALRC
jgi:hypothetical protein